MILRVCVVSATSCSRLERKALETNGVEDRRKAIVEPEEQRTHRMLQNKQTTTPAAGFSHSPDYRSVIVRGETYTLTSQQAQMIQILHEAHENGTPDISIAHILEKLEKRSSRWQDTFKSYPKARALVKSSRKGTLRLNL